MPFLHSAPDLSTSECNRAVFSSYICHFRKMMQANCVNVEGMAVNYVVSNLLGRIFYICFKIKKGHFVSLAGYF